jgi:hypothetical protein
MFGQESERLVSRIGRRILYIVLAGGIGESVPGFFVDIHRGIFARLFQG